MVGAISKEDDDVIFHIGASDGIGESAPFVLVNEFDVVLIGPGFDLRLVVRADDDDPIGDGLGFFDNSAEDRFSAQGKKLLGEPACEGLHANAFSGGGDYCRHRQIVCSLGGEFRGAPRGLVWL